MRAVEVLSARWIVRHPAPDIRILERVEVDRVPVGVVRPRARALPARARRRHRVAALERTADIVVLRLIAGRPVHLGEAHVPDREPQRVQLAKDAHQRPRHVLVDDELAHVPPPVEADRRHAEQPELGQRDRAARVPDVRGLELRLLVRRQRTDRVLERRRRRSRGGSKRRQHQHGQRNHEHPLHEA